MSVTGLCRAIVAFALLAALGISGSDSFAAGQPKRPNTTRGRDAGGQSVPVFLTIEPYVGLEGCGALITSCRALAFVPPPCDGKLKTVVNTFTLKHNLYLYATAWRCGGLGGNSCPPSDGSKVLYKIEFIASGATTPFYTYGFVSLPSLRPISLGSLDPGRTLGRVTVRVTRQATKPSWLQGDWLAFEFNGA
ncbi:MAG TPA: hypothetical protein VGM51_11480 [Armatimonadota bacterium]|jgi:hypothetical protein